MLMLIVWKGGLDRMFSGVRIFCYSPHLYLKENENKLGIKSVWYNDHPDIINQKINIDQKFFIFHKCFTKEHIAIAKMAKEKGYIIVYHLADPTFKGCENWKGTHTMLRTMDFGMGCSKGMIRWMKEQCKALGIEKKIYYWGTALEDNYPIKQHKGQFPTIGWWGWPKNFYLYLKPLNHIWNHYRCCWIHNLDCIKYGITPTIVWKETTWTQNIYNNFDISITPLPQKDSRGNEINYKSPHKILLPMAMGIPVICSPIGEYKKIIKHGETGFFAETDEEWHHYIRLLHAPKLRNKIGLAARESVIEKHSKKTICKELIKVLHNGLREIS